MISKEEYEVLALLAQPSGSVIQKVDYRNHLWGDVIERLLERGLLSVQLARGNRAQTVTVGKHEYHVAREIILPTPSGLDAIASFEQSKIDTEQREQERKDAKRESKINKAISIAGIVVALLALGISAIANWDKLSAFVMSVLHD